MLCLFLICFVSHLVSDLFSDLFFVFSHCVFHKLFELLSVFFAFSGGSEQKGAELPEKSAGTQGSRRTASVVGCRYIGGRDPGVGLNWVGRGATRGERT